MKLISNKSDYLISIGFCLLYLLPSLVYTYYLNRCILAESIPISEAYALFIYIKNAVQPAMIIIITLYCLDNEKSTKKFLGISIKILALVFLSALLLEQSHQPIIQPIGYFFSSFNIRNTKGLILCCFFQCIWKDYFKQQKEIFRVIISITLFFIFNAYYVNTIIKVSYLPFVILLITTIVSEKKYPVLCLSMMFTIAVVVSSIAFDLTGILELYDISISMQMMVRQSIPSFVSILALFSYARKRYCVTLINILCVPFVGDFIYIKLWLYGFSKAYIAIIVLIVCVNIYVEIIKISKSLNILQEIKDAFK